MANQDLILGQSDNNPALDQHPMLASHDHNLELNHENQEHHLQDMSKNHNSELDSGHSIDLEESGNQAQQNESLMEPKPNREDNHELDNSEVYLLDGNVTEQQELDDVNTDNLDLSVEHNEEGMQMVVHHDHNQVVEYVNEQPLVVQARAIMASPHYELAVGQEFTDVKSCRRALRDTAIALHFEIQTIKSDKNRFTAKCASEGCPWRIHAAKLPGVPNFTIRTINGNHTCGGISHLGHHQASVQWVAESVEQRLLENPNCKPKEILEEIHRTHGITLSYKQAWRGKERVMAAMRGSFEEGYRLLPQYCAQIKRTNPGSIASVYSNPTDGSFQRLFISFHASIYGFLNACRPLLGLDRTILKSKYLGTLLVAAGVDGDGAVFPLAFGVVDEENDDNWMWFLSELHNLLEMNSENMPMLTILSDRRKGIVDGVGTNFPTAFHGFCLRHLCESFRKEFNNTILVNLLWEAGHALTRVDCLAKIAEMKEMSGDAVNWVERVPLHLWATSFFEGTRFGHLTANIVENLNSWISEASSLPIVQMMECIRRQLMTWFNERREASLNWTSILVPSAERHIADSIEAAQNFQVFKPGEQFEVVSSDGTRQTVDVRNRCCLCRGWQLYGLPCAHAVAALLSCRQNVHRFTDSCFTVAAYRKAYSETIHPIPDKSLWKEMMLEGGDETGIVAVDEVVVNPPQSFRAPGRPRKRRVRAEDQGKMKRVVHCSRCNQTGHFRTTCAAPI